MGLIYGYMFFALVTTLMSIYKIFIPVYKSLKIAQADNMVVQAPYLSAVAFSCMSYIIAPLMFIAVIVPHITEAFKYGMLEGFLEK